MAEFQFIVNGELVTYDSWENIPEEFEHVIKFIPDIPPEPHTEDEHAEIEIWNTRLQQLMEKERARSN
jgi:hypothetical protein|tara:strand:- start:208 stop:411 length:204 start_codon:yes stop_codon:yes gene_type:complete